MKPSSLIALALCLSTTAVVGQDKVPQVEFEGFGQTEATSLADFDGRLVLLESFAFW